MLDTLGKQLRKARKAHYPNDTASDFALRVGVSRATYLKMEKGGLSVSMKSYYDAAKILDLEEGFDSLFLMPENLLDD